MQLTVTERLILRNQLTIMKALQVPNISPGQFDEMIEIVESGYEIFYSDVLSGVSEDGTPRAVTKEVLEILDLFRALHDAAQNGVTLNPGAGYAKFAGFDGNAGTGHLGFSRFLLDVQGKYQESAPAKNSHSSGTLPTYQRMVATWKSLGGNYQLSQADADAILK